jgi:hypothetical protein
VWCDGLKVEKDWWGIANNLPLIVRHCRTIG